MYGGEEKEIEKDGYFMICSALFLCESRFFRVTRVPSYLCPAPNLQPLSQTAAEKGKDLLVAVDFCISWVQVVRKSMAVDASFRLPDSQSPIPFELSLNSQRSTVHSARRARERRERSGWMIIRHLGSKEMCASSRPACAPGQSARHSFDFPRFWTIHTPPTLGCGVNGRPMETGAGPHTKTRFDPPIIGRVSINCSAGHRHPVLERACD